MLGHGPIASAPIAGSFTSIAAGPKPVITNPVILDQGKFPEFDDTALGPTLGFIYTSIPFTIDVPLGADPPSFIPGIIAMILVPTFLQILGWGLASKDNGSITVDIWRQSLANCLAGQFPTSANSITGSVQPSLVGPGAARGSILTGWTTHLQQNDVLFLNITAASTLATLEFLLFCQRDKLQ